MIAIFGHRILNDLAITKNDEFRAFLTKVVFDVHADH